MATFILHMPLRFFARVFGNPAGDPVLLKSRGVTLLRDTEVIFKSPRDPLNSYPVIVALKLSHCTSISDYFGLNPNQV